MRRNNRTLCRAALAVCAGLVIVVAPITSTTTARAANGSTWYWQNPLPRDYGIQAVACPSVSTCVVVVASGLVVTTNDGGQHWVDRPSGIKLGLHAVTCPGPALCYALGSEVSGNSSMGQPPDFKNQIFKTANGGRTWQQPSPQLPTGRTQGLTDLVCPSVTTCLAAGSTFGAQGENPILRTTDSGKTWRAVNLFSRNGFVSVTCATRTICYAAGMIDGGSAVARSNDSGQTWKLYGAHTPPGLSVLTCPGVHTCYATALDCGGECNLAEIYVSRDGATTWKPVHDGATGDIVCPSEITCYATGDGSVLSTTTSGKTWSIHRVPDLAFRLTCPGPTTCYLTTPVTVLKTSDGFGHTRETLGHTAIHSQTLTDISCPTTDSCYIAGSRNACPPAGPCDQVPASFAATTDSGRTWRTTPQTPDLLERLSCPRVSTCFAIGGADQGPIALDRSDDGARTWHQIGWQQISTRLLANNQASDITCVGGNTCYVLATVSESLPGNNNFSHGLAVLVTHDTGQTWSVQTGIDTAARTGSTGPPNLLTLVAPSRISCPSVTTCFVLATIYTPGAPGHTDEQVVLLSTTDGGKSWTRHLTEPNTVPDSGYPPLGQDLSCPTTTTCYLLSFTENPQTGDPNGLPGPILVTRDAGVSWSRSVVSSGEYLMAITCATAQNCRVAASSGLFATVDGGGTWQRELLADGSRFPPIFSIACPAVDTCYAVGGPEPCCGVIILATHPSGALHHVARRVFGRTKLQRIGLQRTV